MAEISSADSGNGKGKKRSKKMSTKVDMTPMVDLAFLLITFFMLTTTFSKPQTMEVNMPDKTESDEKQAIKESKALTIILGENDKIFWYMGLQDPKVETTDYSDKGVRKLLQSKKAEVPGLIVLIKAYEKSRYKNMVDILDEMHINAMERYSIVDISPVDKELIDKIL